MSAAVGRSGPRRGSELAKVGAFIRRDFLTALSYRTAFVGDLFSLALNAALFALVAKIVDPAQLPAYGGTRTGYLEFVAIGIAFSLVIALLLQRVSSVIRQEQMIGTLEVLLLSPTRMATLQAGAIAYDLIQVPLRVVLFLAVIGLVFGLDLHPEGILPALAALVAFLPFVWGLGLVSAGTVLTFRRGGGVIVLAGALVGFASGAYFPLALLPAGLEEAAEANPAAIAIESVREALIGGAGWGAVGDELLLLAGVSLLTLLIGAMVFRWALARERRLGTLGLY